MSTATLATSYSGKNRAANPDYQAFQFLEFLARIKDGDDCLPHLYDLAHSETLLERDQAFYKLTPDRRDQLTIVLHAFDNSGRLLEQYRLMLQRCIIQRDGDYVLNFGHAADKALIDKYDTSVRSASPTSTVTEQRPK